MNFPITVKNNKSSGLIHVNFKFKRPYVSGVDFVEKKISYKQTETFTLEDINPIRLNIDEVIIGGITMIVHISNDINKITDYLLKDLVYEEGIYILN